MRTVGVNARPSEARRFVGALFAGKPDNLYVLLWTLPEKKSYWVQDVEGAIRLAISQGSLFDYDASAARANFEEINLRKRPVRARTAGQDALQGAQVDDERAAAAGHGGERRHRGDDLHADDRAVDVGLHRGSDARVAGGKKALRGEARNGRGGGRRSDPEAHNNRATRHAAQRGGARG